MRDQDQGMSTKGFLMQVNWSNWGRETHLMCGWHHWVGHSDGLANKIANWAATLTSVFWVPMRGNRIPHVPAAMPSPPQWLHPRTVSQNKSVLLYVPPSQEFYHRHEKNNQCTWTYTAYIKFLSAVWWKALELFSSLCTAFEPVPRPPTPAINPYSEFWSLEATEADSTGRVC